MLQFRGTLKYHLKGWKSFQNLISSGNSSQKSLNIITLGLLKQPGTEMQNQRQTKKKLVQNFQFDPNDVKVVQGYEIINAKNILLNELFTLKRLSLNNQSNQSKHQPTLKQISILKQLNGINIIKFHKILKSKSHLYLVYDYFTGRNLEYLIERNASVIKTNKKIDKLVALKLQQDFVDYLMIQMIGKQLCQVLKEIQSHNIVHMRLWPENIVLGKNNFVKVANFCHHEILKDGNESSTNEQVPDNQFVDPFLKETGNFGFFTDIYSFGLILQKLYNIYKVSQTFKPNKAFQQFVPKLMQNNPYRRPDLEEIYEFFFGNKKQYGSRIRKSRDEAIQKSTKQVQTLKRTPSVSSTKSQKEVPQQISKIRTSKNQSRVRPQRTQMKTVQTRQPSSLSKQSNSVSRTHSQSQKPSRDSNSPSPTQNSPSNYVSHQNENSRSQNFRFITTNILKKRNFSILLLKLGDVIANKITGQSVFTLQLVFMLYKRSLIQIVSLAKYLSKGSKKYMPDITETNRLRFTKTEEYYLISKVVNEQLEEQRNILVSISSLIKKQCPMILSFGSQPKSLVKSPMQSRSQQICTHDLPDFEKQIKYEAFNSDFFMKIIRQYLDFFVSDMLLLNSTTQNAKQCLFYLNILFQLYRCQSFEVFIQQFFSISQGEDKSKNFDNGKIPEYSSLFKKSFRISQLDKMNVQQLSQQLVHKLQNHQF